jgi:hypothetical protein
MSEESVKLFISYCHRDEKLREQLDKHLAPLKGQKVVEAWHDRQIRAGNEWANQIDNNLNKADIILLLVSPDFVASDYCSNIELKQAVKRHENGEAIVVPVILEPCDWSWLPFSKFQAFPKDAKAISTWVNQNEAFLDVVQGIRKVAQNLFVQRQQKFQKKKADQEEYKAKVEEALSLSTSGQISVADRDTLEELCEKLGLTKEEANIIEDHAYRPYKDQQEKLEKYKKTLLKYIENGYYPFSDDVKRQLEIRQRDLGIKTEDKEQIEQPILAEAEAKHQEKSQPEAVERQRQRELDAETQEQLERQRQQFEVPDDESNLEWGQQFEVPDDDESNLEWGQQFEVPDEYTNQKRSKNLVAVYNLSYLVTEEDIKEVFEEYGTVKRVYIPKQKKQKSTGNKHAFVEMATESEATVAIDTLDEAEWVGFTMRVKLAEDPV